MKSLTTLATIATLLMASCTKESTETTTPPQDTTTPVVATFAASITRVTNNAWDTNDEIGITMTETGEATLADGDYENVPYTVSAAGTTGVFSPSPVTSPDVAEIIHFPADGSYVDFYAYFPYGTIDANNDLAVSVASQTFATIDVVAAKVTNINKSTPTVVFSDLNAFKHQLSKLTLTVTPGSGITSLSGLSATTIKGQYTTAKYNTRTNAISGEGDINNITAVTSVASGNASATVEAILIPTTAIAGSTVVFTLDGHDYVWKTDAVDLTQGNEHKYAITIAKSGIIPSGATISDWGTGTSGSGSAI